MPTTSSGSSCIVIFGSLERCMVDFVELASGVVVPEVALAESAPRPELNEIATSRDGRDITQGYIDALPYLPPSDTNLTLGIAGGVYTELARDDKITSDFESRFQSVIACECIVDAGGNRRADKKAADSLREQIAALKWDTISKQ